MNSNIQKLAIWVALLVLAAALFNIFNNNRELQINRRANTSISGTGADPATVATIKAFLRPREIIAPRLLRFGVRWSF